MVQTFDPVTGVASAQGLDVSNYQGNYDWAAAKKTIPGLAFGIYRLTQGLGAAGTNSPDPTAHWNHAQIRDNGLHHGAYHYLDPRLDGAAQARYFVDCHDRLGFTRDDMLWLDNETPGPAPTAVAACAQAFMAELAVLRPDNPKGVYSYIHFIAEGYCNGLGTWPLWLAYPNLTAPQPPPPWARWAFWQWGQRNGTDADAFNGTAADLNAWIASFTPPAAPYKHATDGTQSITAYAHARGMHAGTWLAEQQRLGGKATADALGSAIPKAGLTWYSNTP